MLAVLFLDLDRFKHINDSRGHEVGDKLLQEIAKRVRAAVRPADIVVRMGGDEFVVVLHKVNAPDEVGLAATRINEVLSAPVMIDGRALVATVSIGVSLFPRDGATMGELLKHSDTAMYQAKDLGRNNFQVFSPQMDRDAQGTRGHRIVVARRPEAQSSSTCTTSPSSTSIRGASPVSRPCCAGNIRRRDSSRRSASSRWPRKPASSFRSGSSCSTASAATSTQWREQGAHLVPVSMNVSAVQLERTQAARAHPAGHGQEPHRAAAHRSSSSPKARCSRIAPANSARMRWRRCATSA